MSLNLVRLVYAVTAAALVLVYYALPGARPAAAAAVGGVSVAAIVLGVARLRPQRSGAALLIAFTVLLFAVGALIIYMGAAPTIAGQPVDVFLLSAYLPLTVALLWIGRPRLPSRDWPMILDTVALSLAGSFLAWIMWIRPAVTSHDPTGAGTALAIASGVGSVAVLAASVRVVLAWRTNLALALLGTGVVAFLVADFLFERARADGTWSPGGPIDFGFLAFCLLCGAAALTPSMTRVVSAEQASHHLGPGRLTMLAVAMLVAPTALLVEATSGTLTIGVASAILSAALAVLILVRLSLAVKAYGRRAAREQAVRAASRALGVAIAEREVVAALGTALRAMLPEGAPCDVRLVDRAGRDNGGPTLSPCGEDAGAATGEGGMGELCVAVQSEDAMPVPSTVPRPADGLAGRVVIFNAPMVELVELSTILEALADQAGSALARIRLVGQLHAEERERYFRTLVMTATDVILISREGRIDYATPSAQSMFRRDIVGERLDDLIHRHPPGHNGPDQPAPTWPDTKDGAEGYVYHDDGGADIVLVHRRDLTEDPTVNGVVTTLRDVTAERNLQRDLAYRADHDALTGLPNADRFFHELRADSAAEADRRTAPGGGRAALFVDLDDFKAVNDTYGHEIGDRLLATVARRIESCLREDDVAARLGGDEFAVLLRGVPDEAAARAVAQRIADALARPASVDRISVDCQASVGLAYASQRGETDSLLREADTALYTAKAHGKGRWSQYREDMPTPTRKLIDARRRIEEAITSDALRVHYQPIVDLASSRCRRV